MAKTTISSGRSGTRALRGVTLHFLERADESLGRKPPSNGAVHEARKSLKKARAGLRLLRPALGSKVYRRENAALREAAHRLNAARDTGVLLQTLQSLRRRERSLRASAVVADLARDLQSAQARAQAQLRADQVLASLHRTLQQSEQRGRGLRVGRHGWTVLGPGLQRIYRAGRRRTPSARALPPDAALHEWRKQVKYLRYALRMLRPMAPGRLGALERRAHALSDHLGDAHDFALLAQYAQAFGAAHLGSLQDEGLRRLLQIIEQRRQRLATTALTEGELLYQDRPRSFQRRLSASWRHWRGSASSDR